MTSAGLKRPSDFDLPSHASTSGGPNPSWPFASNINHTNKRMRGCTNIINNTSYATTTTTTTNSYVNNTTTTTNSPFKTSPSLLNSINEEVTLMIKNEIHKALHSSNNNCNTNHSTNEPPILTVRQTHMICERVFRESEQRIREEYDKILINKLAEQYDTFVKYTHDHIEKRYNQSNSHQASYLS